ncbi:MAG: hypothetical protein ACX939_10735 [Hyphococcus sp.]
MSANARYATSERYFYIFGAIAAIITAGTTLLLWWLPQQYASPITFEDAIALHANAPYITRLWVNFFHVFLALLGYAAAAWAVRGQAPVAAAIGFAAYGFWCFSEALGVSMNIWALNGDWRASYASAGAAERDLIEGSIHTIQGIWDGIFFVVLMTFLVGTIAYAVALFRGGALQKVLAGLFLLAAPLTLIIMADGYFGASLSQWIEWSYPTLQPVSRALLGIWLFSVALKRPSHQT